MSRWEYFDHGADIGVRGIGRSRSEAFRQAALALAALVADPQSVRPERSLGIVCAAPDDDILLFDWLNRLVYLMSSNDMIFHDFHVTVTDGGLAAMASGEPVDRRRHEIRVEPKGATYTELSVAKTATGDWIAQCVIDV